MLQLAAVGGQRLPHLGVGGGLALLLQLADRLLDHLRVGQDVGADLVAGRSRLGGLAGTGLAAGGDDEGDGGEEAEDGREAHAV